MKLPQFLLNLRNKPLVVRRVVGESMLPTLRPGQIVVGCGWLGPRVGDIVIANIQGREVIKRVVTVDGSQLEIIGENRLASTDSRDYGAINREAVIARVVVS